MYRRFHSDVPASAAIVNGVLRAPCAILAEVGGPPEDEFGDKVSTAWCFQCIARPRVVLVVHDFQDEDDHGFSLARFRALPSYDWSVSGPTEEVAELCRWLSAEVIRRVAAKKGRALTPESREQINALIKSGVGPAEATKRAAVWQETPIPTDQFAWPIVDRVGRRE